MADQIKQGSTIESSFAGLNFSMKNAAPGTAFDYNQEKYAEAEPLYRRALAVLEKALGPDHPHVGVVRSNLDQNRDHNLSRGASTV
jgi:hypothetical protein